MKIVVLKGSPNINGSTAMLVDNFIKGATEAGHTIDEIDAAHSNISPCIGCVHCGYEGECVLNDDMDKIRQKILDSDMLVFATPLYYYGMSAQLKTLIDRLIAQGDAYIIDDYPVKDYQRIPFDGEAMKRALDSLLLSSGAELLLYSKFAAC